jgi:hypothetical protein
MKHFLLFSEGEPDYLERRPRESTANPVRPDDL